MTIIHDLKLEKRIQIKKFKNWNIFKYKTKIKIYL